jgi:succinyl-CoA synthetase alpha subunit
MGHAGAIIGGADDTAQAKIDALRACGITVSESPADLGSTMATALGDGNCALHVTQAVNSLRSA